MSSLRVEQLEGRTLLSVACAREAIDAPDTLGPTSLPNLLADTAQVCTGGTIVNRAQGSGDVDWYRFDLAAAARVVLTIPADSSSLSGVLSLYNTSEPYDAVAGHGDPYTVVGHRLLIQTAAAPDSTPTLTRDLASGTYYVAVSGAGNFHFHPFIADSGYPGFTGDYVLDVTATPLALDPGTASVLAVDPSPGSRLDHSPLVVRVSLSGLPGAGQTFELRDVNGTVGLAWSNVSTLANEVQLAPERALAPGSYRVVRLEGGSETVLSEFQITGIEENPSLTSADDHPGGAHELALVIDGGVVQRTGAIGDDPAYDPRSSVATLSNRSSDVDLYHFRITAPGPHALIAEVFAGRIGSPLNPGLSLFKVNGEGVLELYAVNDNSFNTTRTSEGNHQPLLLDALLFAALTPGDYYLAVSSSGPLEAANVPDPAHGVLPGPSSGVFDPNISHSGRRGWTVGGYVLNVLVYEDSVAPEVVSSAPASGAVLLTVPTQLVVRFSEGVNLAELANQAFTATFPFPPGVAAAYLQEADGSVYYLGLHAYDTDTNEATMVLAGGLPNGSYQLHLVGVADFAGNPLLTDDPSGHFVIPFTLNDPGAGAGLVIQREVEPNDDLGQFLGTLGRDGLAVRGDLGSTGIELPDFVDIYTLELTAATSYVFMFSPVDGSALPEGLTLLVLGEFGVVPAALNFLGGGIAAVASRLEPGFYTVIVAFQDPAQAVPLSYELRMAMGTLPENPRPLWTSPGTPVGVRIAGRIPPPPQRPPLTPPPLTPTGNNGPSNNPASPPGVGGSPLVSLSNLQVASLLALGAGPAGGVQGPGGTETLAAGDRVTLGGASTTLLAALVRLTLLTPQSSGGAESPGTPTLGLEAIEELLQRMGSSWGKALDGLFSMSDSLLRALNPSAIEEEETEPWEPSPEIDGDASIPGLEFFTVLPGEAPAARGSERNADEAKESGLEMPPLVEGPTESPDGELAWALALAAGALCSLREDGRPGRDRHADRARGGPGGDR